MVERSWNAAEGLYRLTLSNGLKVILKPTTFSNEQIMFRAFAPGGTSVVPDEDFPSAMMASSLIASGGAGNYDATQLSRYLAGKQVAALPFIGEILILPADAPPDAAVFAIVIVYDGLIIG